MDIYDYELNDTVRKTYGNYATGNVEGINYLDQTLVVWFADTEHTEEIHVKGVTK